MFGGVRFCLIVGLLIGLNATSYAQELLPPKAADVIRIATYNVSLYRSEAGELANDLAGNDDQARAVAAVIRAVKPDILLVNELDYSTEADNAAVFASRYVNASETDALGGTAWPMPHVFSAEVNTGVPSNLD